MIEALAGVSHPVEEVRIGNLYRIESSYRFGHLIDEVCGV